MNSHPPRFRFSLLALLLAATLLSTGCVRRRLAVRSNPPGALVFVDNQQIGTTPCSVDFTYYGTREIRLVKPGYETLTVNQPIPTPWYEFPPLDFVSENIVPNKILDHRTASFELQPQLIVPTEQLLDRANELRQATFDGAAMPAASVAIPNVIGPPSTPPTQIVPTEPAPFNVPPPGSPPPPTTLPPTSSVAPPPTFSPLPADATTNPAATTNPFPPPPFPYSPQ